MQHPIVCSQKMPFAQEPEHDISAASWYIADTSACHYDPEGVRQERAEVSSDKGLNKESDEMDGGLQ